MKPALRRATAALLGATVLAGSFATTVAAADPSTTTMTIDLLGARCPGAPRIHADRDGLADAGRLGRPGRPSHFVDADGSAVGCAAAPVDAVGNQTSCTINSAAPGTYHFKATYYNGNDVLRRARRATPPRAASPWIRTPSRRTAVRRVGRIDLPGEGRLPRHRDPVRQPRRVDRRHDQHLQQQQQAGSPRHEGERGRFVLQLRVERTRQQGRRAPGRQVHASSRGWSMRPQPRPSCSRA